MDVRRRNGLVVVVLVVLTCLVVAWALAQPSPPVPQNFPPLSQLQICGKVNATLTAGSNQSTFALNCSVPP